jgi:Ca-activated chloride channel family protein
VNAVHFAAPENIHVFWLVLALAGAIAFFERRGGTSLGALVSLTMQAVLVRQMSLRRRLSRLALFVATGAFLTLALMRPQVGLRFVETPRVGAEIMICLDVSNSMLAEDAAPNRLERAKAEIRDLLSYLSGDQVGLIAFAGRATVLSPMTPDFGFLRLVLDEAGTGSVSRGGTRLEEPIRKAIAGFGDAGDVSRSILLITDGEDHDSFPLEAAKEAGERGIRILAVGFGDEAGAEIMITDPRTGARSALRDGDGNIVRSRLDGEMLRQMALATDGAYIPAGTGVLDLESIYERHIARLTRGRLDGRGRAVRDDTFQLAILFALVCLIAAVAVASRATAPADTDRRGMGALVGPLLLAGALLGASPPAHAQPNDDTQAAAAAQNTERVAQDQPTKDSSSDKERDADTDPRDAYNNAIDALAGDRLDSAESDFEFVREQAGTDGEARYRATYNLGWVEVKRADLALADNPEGALEALGRAGSWFQRAVDLRPGSEDPRYNLELVSRRAVELADRLREEEDIDLLGAVTALLERQRGFIDGLATLVDAAARADSPAGEEAMRSAFRSAAASQLEILSEADEVAERAVGELAAIQAKSEEERSPEEAVQAARIGGFLHYTHRARERIGQARARMRRLEAERSYRRAAASLDELKRARDQLLEPVAILDQLIADGVALARQTATRMTARSGLIDNQTQAAAWLTQDYLTDSQITLTERADELYVAIEAGLQHSAASEQELPPEQARFVEQIAEATPHISLGAEAFRSAAKQLHEGKEDKALEAQSEALAELMTARESFLDLRRLVDLLYETEARISLLLDNDENDGGIEAVLEYSTAALDLHNKNLDRSARIEKLIDQTQADITLAIAQAEAGAESPDGSAPDPQALEQERQRYVLADLLADAAIISMHSAHALIGALEHADEDTARMAVPATLEAVEACIEKIGELRRLFFNLIEHLKDTARQQVELGDETEVIAALADDDNLDATALALGPLEPRQRNLAEVSSQLSVALSEQSRALSQSDPAASGQDPAQLADAVSKMAEASTFVAAASADMTNASGDMLINPAPLPTVRGDQHSALDNLLAAIALLEPPPPPEQQEGEESEDQQEQPGEQDGQPEQPEHNTDPSQLLQGVRDREAQRRAEQAEQDSLQYDPVEKDW